MSVPVAFLEVLELAAAHGLTPLTRHHGAIEVPMDPPWRVWVNGSKDADTIETDYEIGPMSVVVTFNGLPAGDFDIAGRGVICGHPNANEDALIEALRDAARSAREGE